MNGARQLLRATCGYKVFLCLICVLSWTASVRAQVDSTYIKPFDEELSLGTYFYYQYTSLVYEREGHPAVTYRPNSPIGVGFSFSYKNFGIGAGMGVRSFRNKKYGDTKALDLQYHYFGRNLMADIFFQQYKGYYKVEKNQEIALYPDIGVTQYGIHAEYVFNNKQFSYKAAFNQSERQLKSAGSFHLGGGVYYNKLTSDSTLTLYGDKKFRNYQLSVTGGYGYNWVLSKQFHIAASMSLGVNFGTVRFPEIEKVEVTPSFLPRIAAGYDGKGWSIGLWYVLNSMYINRYNSLDITFNTGYAQLTLIKRFDHAPKFFKKIRFLN